MLAKQTKTSKENTQEESFKMPIHFFKIIPYNINTTKLGIPPSFVKKHGYAFQSTPIYLKDPVGNTWEIELLKGDNGEIWMENGWQQFARYYALDHGHFLTFRHDGDGRFHVIIFGKSGIEIDYPHSCNLVSIQTLDGIAKGSSKRQREARSYAADQATSNSRKSPKLAEKAMEDAAKLISESKYPSFKFVQTYKKNTPMPYATLSYKVIHKYFKHNTEVRLKVDDREWRVKLLCYADSHTSSFSAGWSVFSTENRLKAGDVCVAELVEEKVMQVTIFKGSQ